MSKVTPQQNRDLWKSASFGFRNGFTTTNCVMPADLVRANNRRRAEETFLAYARFLMDSGEWIRLREVVRNVPSILEGTKVVKGVIELVESALLASDDFERFKSMYSGYATERGGAFQDAGINLNGRYHTASALLETVEEPVRSVINLGCGDGVYDLRLIDQLSPERYAVVDVSDAAHIAQALQVEFPSVSVTYHQVKAGLYDWPSDPVDLVVALEIIEHVPDQDLFLTEAWSRVAPGGHLLLSTPDASFWVVPTNIKKGQPEQHITANTLSTLVERLKRLQPERIDAGQSLDNHLVVLVKKGCVR